jgi:hypothetical protein
MKKELYTEHGGLSMTSAQYLSNLGQEKANEYKEKLKEPQFYNTNIKIVGDQSYTPMSLGMSQDDLKGIPGLLEFIAKMDAFTAYVREAMKDKDLTLNGLRRMSISEWIRCSGHDPLPEDVGEVQFYEDNGLIQKSMDDIEKPEMPSPEITELEVLVKKLPLTEYQKYLELDAKAAVLGKFCHSDKAPLVLARRDYLTKQSKPLEKEGTGRDTCVYQYEPSVPKEALEETFEGLQKAYREASKELNKIRFDLREKEAQRFQTENAEYQKALAEYNRISKETDEWNSELRKKYIEYRKEINRKTQEIQAEFEDWRSAERNRVSKLKIIIPEALQETYEYLESLGKQQNKD